MTEPATYHTIAKRTKPTQPRYNITRPVAYYTDTKEAEMNSGLQTQQLIT